VSDGGRKQLLVQVIGRFTKHEVSRNQDSIVPQGIMSHGHKCTYRTLN